MQIWTHMQYYVNNIVHIKNTTHRQIYANCIYTDMNNYIYTTMKTPFKNQNKDTHRLATHRSSCLKMWACLRVSAPALKKRRSVSKTHTKVVRQWYHANVGSWKVPLTWSSHGVVPPSISHIDLHKYYTHTAYVYIQDTYVHLCVGDTCFRALRTLQNNIHRCHTYIPCSSTKTHVAYTHWAPKHTPYLRCIPHWKLTQIHTHIDTHTHLHTHIDTNTHIQT